MEIEVSKFMEYEQLCKSIFDIDKQIRFAAVYNSKIEKVAGGIRKGVKTLIPESITKLSVEQSFIRWNTRILMEDWIGLPKYALAEYEKIKRFTFYLEKNMILLVSAELELDNNLIINRIRQLI
ncbi:MAG: hypothetical protein HOO66_05680 [Nitrosarchaeum sp.]|nr:hypothetical protein [Nitrosarchaeum sp.]